MNANNNFGHLLSLKQIFQEKRFIIPEYQRGYSWGKSQRDDLLKDIESMSGSDHKHFTGTIVASKTNKEDLFEIVDGQQRLTSIIILLNEILRQGSLPENEQAKKWEQRINMRSEGSELLRVFKMNSETDDIFKECIIDGKEKKDEDLENKSQENLIKARKQFGEWVQSERYSPIYFNIIVNQLGFLFFSPVKSESIGIMFEVINNRGKPLSELEKIKNYLIYFSVKMKLPFLGDKIKTEWRNILKNLSIAGLTSNEDENSFLRNCWILYHTTDKRMSYHAYENLKVLYPADGENGNANQLFGLVDLLVEASEALREFYTAENEQLAQLRYHPVVASILPLYLAISIVYKKDLELRFELLGLLEKLNFRVYVLPGVTKRADTGQGHLFWLAHQLFQNNYPYEDKIKDELIGEVYNDEVLREKLVNFTINQCDLDDFVQALTLDRGEKYDYIHWNGLRYFLANYEISLSSHSTVFLSDLLERDKNKKKSDDILHREHIWAKENNAEMYNNDEDKPQKRRLGNFALLEGGINSRGDKLDVWKKVRIYKGDTDDGRRSNIKMIQFLEKFVDSALEKIKELYSKKSKNWYIDLHKIINDERESLMIHYAIDRWGFEEEKNYSVEIDSFADRKALRIFNIRNYNKPTSASDQDTEIEL